MPTEVTEKKRRFDKRDLDVFAEFVSDELSRRKRKRLGREKQWDDIDRQLAMEPDASYKKGANGRAVPEKAWMSEMELPLQAQTLEVLSADAKRMMSPDTGPWFASHALTSDEYLARVDFKGIIAGDENEVPSKINQDNADKLVDGWLSHLHRQYGFWENINRINAEAFKYGVGVGRARMVKKETFIDSARGVVRTDTKIPMLVPRSIRDVYLDDSQHAAMNEGIMIGPSTISAWKQKVEDLILAARRGSNDPKNETGGWMPANVAGMEGDSSGEVEVIEYEGDMIAPRKTVRSLFVPNVIVTVVKGMKNNQPRAEVVRLRFRQTPYSTFIPFPYHSEEISSAYATSPLMKGRVIQLAAAQALSRLMDSAALSNEPPLRYSPLDMKFESEGGPRVFPGARWPTDEDVEAIRISDPAAMLNVYISLLGQYSDQSGVNPPRLGAQTVSHTTAYAKDQEISRGTVRTVDYVRDTLDGPMKTWLYMEYEMSRKHMQGKHVFYIDAYKGFVNLEKADLPDMAVFDVFGAGGPSEQREKAERRMAAMQMAIQVDQLKVQAGLGKPMNYERIQEQMLLEGGWVDVDPFFNAGPQGSPQGTPAEPGVPGDTGGNPGAETVALQALATGQG